MDYKKRRTEIERLVKEELMKDKTGHDFEHIKRVLKTSKKIAKNYPPVDLESLEIACLLHDISCKDGLTKNHHLKSSQLAEKILLKEKLDKDKIEKIKGIIIDHVGNISKSFREDSDLPIESKILRDADNLDALGSIGLIRMISFSLKQEIPYFTSEADKLDETIYGNVKFLLDWPEKMLTKEGKNLAKKKINILKKFLVQLKKEYKE